MKRKTIWCLTCAFSTEVANFGPVAKDNADKRHLKHDGAHEATWIDEETDRRVDW